MSKLIKQVIYVRDEILVLNSDLVEGPIVDAQTKRTIMFLLE